MHEDKSHALPARDLNFFTTESTARAGLFLNCNIHRIVCVEVYVPINNIAVITVRMLSGNLGLDQYQA